MAERRMFSKTIIDSDAFLEMPLSTQALYFHLSMRADDDGFINNPKKILKMIGASEDDFKVLFAKRFLIYFDSGIVVIKHWRIHNYIQNDRYKPTVYFEEKEQLETNQNKEYLLKNESMYPNCIQDVSKMETQVRLGKVRLDKDRLGESDGESETPKSTPKPPKHVYGEFKHVRLTDDEYQKLVNELGQDLTDACITFLDEYIEEKGYKSKSHIRTIKRWVINAVKERNTRTNKVAEQLEQSYEMMSRWAEEDEDGN